MADWKPRQNQDMVEVESGVVGLRWVGFYSRKPGVGRGREAMGG